MLFDDASKARCIVEARVIDRTILISWEGKMMVTDIKSLFVDALAVFVHGLGRARGSVLVSVGVILEIN